MTIAPERAPRAASATGDAAARSCLRCQAPLADDQEWCLECGAAAVAIKPPRGWRIPLAVVAVVVVLVAAAFAIALTNLSTQSDRSTTVTVPVRH